MSKHPPEGRVSIDRDGVRTVRSARRAEWLIGLAIGIPVVVTAVVIVIRLAPAGARPTAPRAPEPGRVATDAGASDAFAPRPSRRAAAPEPADPHAELKTVTGPAEPREPVVPRRITRAADHSQGVPTPIGQRGHRRA